MRSFRVVFNCRSAAIFCCLFFAVIALHAQNGAITGTVQDKQGALVPGAHVTLLDQERAGVRKMDSTAEGMFMFGSLPPSTYMVTIEVPGFKKWEKKDIKLTAGDRVGVSDVVLEIGQVTETVTVAAEASTLQTESANVSGTVTSQQVTELASFDRNFVYLMRNIPGVSIILDTRGGSANINGQRRDQVSFKLDGTLNMDMGDNTCCSSLPNLDMIQEMKVVTNNATADMGTVGASQVMIVTKSGSKEFHGSGYYFQRREYLNANSWTNNRQGSPRGRDRSNQAGFTLGGPLFIPKVFNTKREKLFFFVSEEKQWNLSPSTTLATVPTALERIGDFSQSKRSDGTAITVLDPTNNRAPFALNQVPSSMWNADMRKLMNLMPLPTANEAADTDYNYNFRQENPSTYTDLLQQSYKVDYNLSEKWRLYGRFSRDRKESGAARGMGNFWKDINGQELGWTLDWRTAWNSMLNVTTIISPTTTNEVVISGTKNADHHFLNNVTYLRSNLGLNYTNLYPNVVRGDFGPRITWGGSGLGNAPTLGTGSPYMAINPDYQINDNFTKVLTRHTFKVGGTYQLDRKDQDPWGGTNHPGNFQFSRDSVNPGDTDYQFANMLTGAFQTFDQVKKVVEGRFVFHQGEWWVMDTWKARPNLTIDLGLRFSVFQPMYDSKGQMSTFSRNIWDPTKVVSLYGYAAGGKALDPTTGLVYPSFLRETIVIGSGNIDNGFTLTGQNGTEAHLIPYAGVQYAPRIGIAWQPKFLPKTVIRMGAGEFKDRLQGNVTFWSVQGPPTVRSSTLRYGNVANISSALFNIFSPPSVTPSGYTGSGKIPKTIQWNFAIQRELPRGNMLTVSYVGSISRHLIYQNRLNEPYYGAAWTAAAQDPTKTPLFDGTTSMPINFYRPYRGISSLSDYASGLSSNYNALQVQFEKRMSRTLSYGVAYTWSKTLGMADEIWNGGLNPFNMRAYDYTRTGYDRTQVLTANFVAYLPKVGKNGNFLDLPGVRLALNDWQLSGFVTATTGSPASFSCGFSTGASAGMGNLYTGQPNLGPRCYVGEWRLSSQADEFTQWNVAAIAPPLKGSVGLESGQKQWSNPATFFASPEITLMKNVPFSQDGRRYFQFRLETYNTMNHHDYTGRSYGVTFYSPTDLRITNLPDGSKNPLAYINPTTGVQSTGGRFGVGALSGAASPRRVQLSLKMYF